MYKKESFDKILKSSLVRDSNHLFVTNDMFDKIICRLEPKKSERNVLSFLAKKAVPIAVCFSLFISLFFVFSPQAKVWAAERINKLYHVIKGDNGYKAVEQDVLRIINGDGYVIKEEVTKDTVDTYVVRYRTPALENTNLTGEKLNKYLGYNVKLPVLLEQGFRLTNKSVIKEEKNSLLLAVYKNSHKIFIVTSNQILSSSSDNKSMVKVGDKDGTWFESPIMISNDGEVIFDPTQKPDKVKTNHILSWEDNGVYYSLMDIGNDMPIEKAVDIAKNILASN